MAFDREGFVDNFCSRHPEIVWAQRSDCIFLTVELPDAKNPKVKLEPEGKFFFSAVAGPDLLLFEIELELFDKVNVEASKINVGLRNIFCVIQKQEKGWWKRLLKAEGKPPLFLKVDWNKWVDEDEEDVEGSKFDDFDFSGMDDFSKANGDAEPDSDDEGMLYLPDLQKSG
ncbi:hypothetical protein GOP47_0004305 [Adiantum capillus-veneris]|uniref:CS domain-containing protein n=1 Tax=Adiantum capillus-veneris TaxID=13818 RepID=A0A9D4V7V7_ADICA|nr:hypothetical protein GOP47_0004305 [Adiantum capillus-veneris]